MPNLLNENRLSPTYWIIPSLYDNKKYFQVLPNTILNVNGYEEKACVYRNKKIYNGSTEIALPDDLFKDEETRNKNHYLTLLNSEDEAEKEGALSELSHIVTYDFASLAKESANTLLYHLRAKINAEQNYRIPVKLDNPHPTLQTAVANLVALCTGKMSQEDALYLENLTSLLQNAVIDTVKNNKENTQPHDQLNAITALYQSEISKLTSNWTPALMGSGLLVLLSTIFLIVPAIITFMLGFSITPIALLAVTGILLTASVALIYTSNKIGTAPIATQMQHILEACLEGKEESLTASSITPV